MTRPLTLLLSSAGRRMELLECFRRDARALGLELRVVAADAQPGLSAACRAADAWHEVPRCDDPALIPALRHICAVEEIDLLVPTIDPELAPLARAREDFAAQGTRVAVSSVATVELARDKARTAAFLQQHGLPAPRTLTAAEWRANPGALRFPVILKPIDGSGSRGLREVPDLAAARATNLPVAGFVAQEKHVGTEYTVNFFCDRAGRLRAAVPHERIEVRAGEVSKGRTVRHSGLQALAARLAACLPGPAGALCFQAISPAGGEPAVFELNARFGGGFPLAHEAGAPFTRWLLEEAAGLPVTAHDLWAPGVTMLRHDRSFFVRES